MKTNSNTHLDPFIPSQGPALEFDFPAMQIGVAEYEEGPTGCTVFYFPAGVSAAVDIRGGSFASIFTEQLSHGEGWLHGICLTGGSLYGLEAVTGVSAEIFAARDYSTGFFDMALVSGAVIYDFRARDNAIYPDNALGRAALRAARPGCFLQGSRGAGRSASVGNGFSFDRGEPGGQGGAFRQIRSTKVAVFTVVNALGAIVDRQGNVARGHLNPLTGRRESIDELIDERLVQGDGPPPHGNTTLTVVVTNQKLDSRSLRQLARQVHSSMARAIQPFHTIYDGDILYAVSTNEVDDDAFDSLLLNALASNLAWDAVLASVGAGPTPKNEHEGQEGKAQ
ncbi:MAG TPA: P1 family peptidase [Armatimonadota bacterium]|nr:P1 family peptidase [Armatimonadota bacterium]